MNTLESLPIGRSCKVTSLIAEDPLRQRFIDLGIQPDTKITALFSSPAGDPRAYMIRGAVIALRGADARKITVSEI